MNSAGQTDNNNTGDLIAVGLLNFQDWRPETFAVTWKSPDPGPDLMVDLCYNFAEAAGAGHPDQTGSQSDSNVTTQIFHKNRLSFGVYTKDGAREISKLGRWITDIFQ